jgi:hypothetical protein
MTLVTLSRQNPLEQIYICWTFVKRKGKSCRMRVIALPRFTFTGGCYYVKLKTKLRGLSLRENYTDRSPLVSEASANFCGQKGDA